MRKKVPSLSENFKLRLAVLFIILVIFPFSLNAQLEIFGYYENRLFLLRNASLGLGDTSKDFSLGDYNRLRLQFKSSPSENISLNLALDFFTEETKAYLAGMMIAPREKFP